VTSAPLQRWLQGAFAGPVLGLAVGAAGAWWVWGTPSTPPAAAGPVAVAAVPVPSAPVPRTPAPVAPKPAPRFAVQAPVARPAPASGPQVCGFGPVAASTPGANGTRLVPANDRRVAFETLERKLETQGDVGTRAAMLAIGGNTPEERVDRADRLARLASTSSDPIVYGLALRRCRQHRAESPAGCQMVTPSQWAALDPGNAAPWLMIAADARQQRNPMGEQEALYRASLASRVDEGQSWLPRLVAQATRGQADLGTALALERAWGTSASQPPVGGSELMQYCRGPVLDAERHQRCESLVQLLWSHGTSLQDIALALRTAVAIHLPSDRIDAMTQERDALTQVAGTHSHALFGNGPADCDSLRSWQAWSAEVGDKGELAALRKQIAGSGRTIAQWSEERVQDRSGGGQVPVHGVAR
jgi:hypothetical protein